MKAFLFFCSLLFWTYASAQKNTFVNTVYNDESGLPQNTINDICKDNQGFIWIATESGLVRYNGRRFSVFKDIQGAASNRMDQFIIDNSGNLLVRNIKNQFFKINNSSIELFSVDSKEYDHISIDNEIKLIPSFFQPQKKEYTYVYSSGNSDFFTRNDSVFVYNNKVLSIKHPITEFKLAYSFGLEGRFFAIDDQFQFYELNLNTGKFDPVFTPTTKFSNFSIKINSPHQQLFVCDDKSIYKINFDLEKNTIDLLQVHDDLNVREEFVNHIFYDEDLKITYFGSWSNGLIVSKKNYFTTLYIDNNRRKNLHYAFDFAGDTIIVATGSIFKEDQLIDEFPIHPQIKTYFVRNSKNEFHYIDYRFLYKKNILKLNQAPEEVFKFNSDLNALYINEEDHIYISTKNFSTTNNSHLLRLIETENNAYSVDTLVTVENDITYIHPKENKVLWIGTENGLFTYNLATNKLILIPESENSHIRNLTNYDKHWWISTYNHGFFFYEDEQLTKIPTGNNINLSTSHHVLEDGIGGIWISTNKGLYRTTYDDVKAFVNTGVNNIIYHYFSTRDGLMTNEFNGGCYPCARNLDNGELIFPSLKGIVKFNPLDFSHYFTPHQVYVERIILDEKEMKTGSFYELPPGKHDLKLYLNTPEFNRKVDYRYQNYVDGKLISKGDLLTNEVFWNGISVGKNKMQFGVIDDDFGNDINQVSIKVNPFYYQAEWFSFVIALGIAFIVVLFFLVSQSRKEKKNKLIEDLVAEKTSQIRESINDLRLTKIALQEQVSRHKKTIGAITHDIKSPLMYLGYGIEYLKQEVKKTNTSPEIFENIEVIDSTVKKLQDYTENILSFSKASLIKNSHLDHEIDLNELINSKIELFRQMARIKKIDFYFESKKNVKLKVNKNLLSVILHNLIDNAVKNTMKGVVKIELKKIADRIIIKVKDTGSGMNKNILKQYRKLLKGKQDQNLSGSGLGAFIIYESAKMIQAKIEIKSEKNVGTEVTILLDTKTVNDR